MGSHKVRSQQTQANNIKSYEVEKIVVENVLSQPEYFDQSEYEDLDLIPRWLAQQLSGAGGLIKPWSIAIPADMYTPVYFMIGLENYLFVSLVDNNSDMPILPKGEFWNNTGRYFSGAWDGSVTYAWEGAIVSSEGNAYRSLQADNENHNPASSPLWWKLIGVFKGDYPIATSYSLNNVVLNPNEVDEYGNKKVYIFVNDDGVYPPTAVPLNTSTWQLVGVQSSGGSGGSDDLSDVTARGNTTPTAIQVTGYDDIDQTIESLALFCVPGSFSKIFVTNPDPDSSNGSFGDVTFTHESVQINTVPDEDGNTRGVQINSESLVGADGATLQVSGRIECEPAVLGNQSVTKDQLDASTYFEKINFTASIGLQLIDFTVNQRGIKFINFAIKVFNVAGNIETEVKGFSNTITKESGLITSVLLDGIFGDGYILITN